MSSTIIDDLKWFLDLNYIPEYSAEEATAEPYDADELSKKIEPEGFLLDASECVEESKSLPAENELSISCGYSSGGADCTNYGGKYDFNKVDKAADDFFLNEKRISTTYDTCELPQTPVNCGKRRGLPPFPQLKKEEKAMSDSLQLAQLQPQSLEDVISALGLTFQQQLLGLIDAKGYTDSQVYRKANLDRKLFSKIRCNKDYKPSKLTALSLAIALELNLDEATDLLGRAGLALSPSNLTDMIIKYCITHRIYDIYDVNALLYEHDQQLLGC